MKKWGIKIYHFNEEVDEQIKDGRVVILYEYEFALLF